MLAVFPDLHTKGCSSSNNLLSQDVVGASITILPAIFNTAGSLLSLDVHCWLSQVYIGRNMRYPATYKASKTRGSKPRLPVFLIHNDHVLGMSLFLLVFEPDGGADARSRRRSEMMNGSTILQRSGRLWR